MRTVEIRGVGFFSPGYADAAALAAGVRDESVVMATPTLASARHLRYTSDVTKMAIAACEQAIAGGQTALSELNVLFASSQGEVQIAVELLETIAAEGIPSPARFMNSVHNTMCGHVSIASRSHGSFSALAGSKQTVSAALIEGFAQVSTASVESLVVVVGDETLPSPLDAERYESMTMAIYLVGVEGAGRGPRLAGITRDTMAKPTSAPSHLLRNPCAPALGFLAALAEKRDRRVRLDGVDGEGWCAELTF